MFESLAVDLSGMGGESRWVGSDGADGGEYSSAFLAGSSDLLNPVAGAGAYEPEAYEPEDIIGCGGRSASLGTLLLRFEGFWRSEPMPLSLVRLGGASLLVCTVCCIDFGSVRLVMTSCFC